MGTVYELTPSWGGGWTQTVLYSADPEDSIHPRGGVVFDGSGSSSGNLYGVLTGGTDPPFCAAAVFELSPGGSGWTEQTLVCFNYYQSGTLYTYGSPQAGLIIDRSGNLYGTAQAAFKLTSTNGNWSFNDLTGLGGTPYAKLVMDSAGNLYGTTSDGGAYGNGNVFKLTLSNGDWTYTSLYDFTGGTDGSTPVSNVVFDANGNLYGTTLFGGNDGCPSGCGVIWEIMP